MITRIVKLEFEESKTEQFIIFFDTIKNKVNSFPGCNGMRLHRDLGNPNIVMTYSNWDSQDSLDKYRESETFGQVWPKIKPWFANKPEAWSVSTYFDGFDSK
ncbi:MAG: antibiotic biosynthesis monooxygenase [Flavobacteriales bacterium]|nr:antibiotic biosynthesis monooxygenase [Flavobacteriales bacterium]